MSRTNPQGASTNNSNTSIRAAAAAAAAAHAFQTFRLNRGLPDPRFTFLDPRIQRFSSFLERNLDVRLFFEVK